MAIKTLIISCVILFVIFVVQAFVGFEEWFKKDDNSWKPDNQKNALNSLSDWAKWLVSLNTFLSAASVYSKGQFEVADPLLLQCAATSFLLSIICAGVLLGAIPAALENIPISPSVYAYKQFGYIQLWFLAFSEHFLLILGLLYLLGLLWK